MWLCVQEIKPIQNKACQDKHVGFLIKSMQLTESIAPSQKKR